VHEVEQREPTRAGCATAAAYRDTDRRQVHEGEQRTARRRTPPRPAGRPSRAWAAKGRPASPGRARDPGRALDDKWPVSVSPPLCTCGSVRTAERPRASAAQPDRGEASRERPARAGASREHCPTRSGVGRHRAHSHTTAQQGRVEYQPWHFGQSPRCSSTSAAGTGSALTVQPGDSAPCTSPVHAT